jgi:lysozyme family protein
MGKSETQQLKPTPRFERWASLTLHVEVGTNKPAGGTRHEPKPGSPLEHLDNPTKEAKPILLEIWESVRCDELPLYIGEATANIALNESIPSAILALQKTLTELGVSPSPKKDGILGPVTWSASWRAPDSKSVALTLLLNKDEEYKQEERDKPELAHFKNWIERNQALLEFVQTYRSEEPQN